MGLFDWHLIFASLMLVSNGPVKGYIVDLGHGYQNYTTTCWNADSRFKVFDQAKGTKEKWYATESFLVSEHCGTHLDAPYHFNLEGWKLDEIPLDRMIVEGVHVDVSNEVNGNGDFLLTAEHLKVWERINGPLPNRSVILVNFGWAHKYGDRQLYYHNNNNNVNTTQLLPLSFPGLSKDAAQWIVDSGKVYGLGVDTPSVDPGIAQNHSYDAHIILSKANLYNLENVALNGTTLPPRGFKIIVQPMKIIGGTGGPCRILALQGAVLTTNNA